jgi:hypothetical protein
LLLPGRPSRAASRSTCPCRYPPHPTTKKSTAIYTHVPVLWSSYNSVADACDDMRRSNVTLPKREFALYAAYAPNLLENRFSLECTTNADSMFLLYNDSRHE